MVTPAPRLYPVDAATVIGQKVTTVEVPGTGILFQEETLTTSGTISMTPVSPSAGTVTNCTYTHLRAHETKANLVCRLLLEKKKKISTQQKEIQVNKLKPSNTRPARVDKKTQQ